jgi:hypothetical protein
VTPTDEQQLILDIDNLKGMIVDVCRKRGRDPVDALMMCLVAASQLYRENALNPSSLGELHEALDKAMEAATSWWTQADEHGGTLQ